MYDRNWLRSNVGRQRKAGSRTHAGAEKANAAP